jgi:hypothetical protein
VLELAALVDVDVDVGVAVVLTEDIKEFHAPFVWIAYNWLRLANGP